MKLENYHSISLSDVHLTYIVHILFEILRAPWLADICSSSHDYRDYRENVKQIMRTLYHTTSEIESGSTYRRFQGLTNNRIIVPGETWQAASCNRASLWKGQQNDHQLTQFCTKRRRYKSPLQFQPCYPSFKNLHYRSRNERATQKFETSKQCLSMLTCHFIQPFVRLFFRFRSQIINPLTRINRRTRGHYPR